MRISTPSTTLAIAAVVLVILPLLVTLATLAANFALESTGADVSIVGRSGEYAILAGWSVVAVAIVGALVSTVLTQKLHA
jgi:hypothetical protein